MVSSMLEIKNSGSTISLFLLILFGMSLLDAISKLPGQSNSFLIWLEAGISLVVIGRILARLLPIHAIRINKFSVSLLIITLYFAFGTGILHYQGEGGDYPTLDNIVQGNEVKYFVDLHNGLHIPVTVVNAFTLGHKNLETVVISEAKNQDRVAINFTFRKKDVEATLPTKVFVVYRAFGFFPLINPLELRWSE